MKTDDILPTFYVFMTATLIWSYPTRERAESPTRKMLDTVEKINENCENPGPKLLRLRYSCKSVIVRQQKCHTPDITSKQRRLDALSVRKKTVQPKRDHHQSVGNEINA